MAFTGNVQNVILPSPKNLPTIGGLYRGPIGGGRPHRPHREWRTR
jgi:hypothetical protein